ncbi:acetoacetate--CoA ligase [Dermatobacter hominis]|uniref:acetoacetate--CoA ligase n=1 Tax=Dermatobacter hominis TaxID=2884263 RepID=UPI001D121692|nr:acetoacetate--CoA ligase [Dermatobacter hominis]UDY37785.1 acetoacetate--CoA ligase [Dermatobacter hominis]
MSDAPQFATEPLWVPPPARVRASRLHAFRTTAADLAGRPLPDSAALHRWSVEHPEAFWHLLVAEALPGVDLHGPVLDPSDHPATTRWFPEVRLNVAEQILGGAEPSSTLLVSLDERGRRRELTRAMATAEVGRVAAALRAAGVGPGDRVAAWMPNTAETYLLMLGAAAVGAVFSSTSPDFGADGVLDRFAQIEPTVLVAADGYTYGGRAFDRRDQLAAVVDGLPTVRRVVVLPFLADEPDLSVLPGDPVTWADWLAPHDGEPPDYVPLPFDHPWYVLYSSGTTGVPKCIVHRAGGVLATHVKEQQLHLDVRAGDRVCWFTTTGWMMWNWLASIPASGASIVLYDGNPAHPGPSRLWDLAAEEGLDLLGVSAKYLDAVRSSGYRPADAADLSQLRTLASTGSPLSPEGFDWVMEAVAPGVGPDGLHLASISGGTDLCGCFVGGDPTRPVYAGELQGPALGMAVDVWRADGGPDDGTPADVGERGELVCTNAFPSMPLGFWGDGPLGEVGPRYRAAYFERFRSADGRAVWAHGDFATWTPHGGMVIHGRSDTTLNPGGVRIGTAEIYRQVERVDGIEEALVFGQQAGDDVRIVLLVRLSAGTDLTDELQAEIRSQVRRGCTPRHVPAVIVQVEDLPRTRSGKLAELAVADTVNGRPVRNTTALANPEVLGDIAAAVPPA